MNGYEKLNVFISTSGNAREVAEELRRVLKVVTRGSEMEFNLYEGTKQETGQWRVALQDYIKNTWVCISCITANNEREEWICAEAGYFWVHDKLIPYLIDIDVDHLKNTILKSVNTFKANHKNTKELLQRLEVLYQELQVEKGLSRNRPTIEYEHFDDEWPSLQKCIDNVNFRSVSRRAIHPPSLAPSPLLEEEKSILAQFPGERWVMLDDLKSSSNDPSMLLTILEQEGFVERKYHNYFELYRLTNNGILMLRKINYERRERE